MFTGIIESIGSIRALTPKGGDVRVYVETGKLDLSDVKLGDSIAVNGVCLTAVELPGDGFWADVSRETLTVTAFVDLKSGSRVNLEKALTPTTRLGGHLVSGHVDGVGEIVARADNARAIQFTVRAPRELAKYIAHKGSITVDGTSLTVNSVNGAEFELTIVPHTLSETIMADYLPGRKVNLEVDLLARYLERLLLGDRIADLFRQPVDVALRYGAPEDSSLVALPVLPDNRRVLCAAPDYLQRHGEPQQVEQLAHHNCLLFMLGDRIHDRWTLEDGKREISLTVSGNRVSDDADVVRRWAVAGEGVAYKSWLDVAADVGAGHLKVLMPDLMGERAPLNLLCAHRAQLSKPVILLLECSGHVVSNML
ncbi:riboflavin synthase [Pseudomonas syringae pv. actinidiae]|nr:riboflavin synthase [Pseudomonas syringae pv. actinidiae]